MNPRVIVAMGNNAGDYLRRKLGADELTHTLTEDNGRRWTNRLYRNAAGRQVAMLTHPGRVAWDAPATDPSDLVRVAR